MQVGPVEVDRGQGRGKGRETADLDGLPVALWGLRTSRTGPLVTGFALGSELLTGLAHNRHPALVFAVTRVALRGQYQRWGEPEISSYC